MLSDETMNQVVPGLNHISAMNPQVALGKPFSLSTHTPLLYRDNIYILYRVVVKDDNRAEAL